MDYKIFWSDESLENLDSILSYLEEEWTSKEIEKFKSKLGKQIQDEVISRTEYEEI